MTERKKNHNVPKQHKAQKQKKKSNRPDKPSGIVGTGVVIVRDLPAFGLRTTRRMNYHTRVALTGTASAVNAYIFSANGIYDPDITAAGAQPIFFDAMMTLYNHYTVRRSRIKCTIQNTTTVPTHVAVNVVGDTTITTDSSKLIANGNIIYAVIEPKDTAESVAVLRHACDSARFQGIDDVLDDPNMRGDAASNPTEQAYFHVSCWIPQNASVPAISMEVEVDYDVVFHEPRKSALSLAEMVELQRVARIEHLARRALIASKPVETNKYIT